MQREHLDKVLSSYQHIGNVVYDMTTSSSARDAHSLLRWFLLDMPIVPFLLAFHCTFAALNIHRVTSGRQFWLKTLVLTTFAAFGGSTLANVLSGQPAPLFTVSSNYMMSYVTIAWYVINHSRAARAVLSFRPVLAVLAFGATAAKVRSILSFMDGFVVRFPDAVLGAVVLSGLAGSGGALFVTLEKIVQDGLQTSSDFSNPGWSFKSAYLAACVYYVATDPVGWIAAHAPFATVTFDKEEVRFAVSLALCTHAAFDTLYGRHVNPLYLVEEVLCALTGVRKPIMVEQVPTSLISSDRKEYAGKKDGGARKGKQGEGLRSRKDKARVH
ncbi:unnamed protein product [Chondrus crispus]|uniref:Transmembrane protein n=1 Tax=Chondrus crispus TaxID=2769 RepID=S0F2W2_CHOCR|nr:unnamed protein product [Chondrus crispus]CDF77481.1 unnamed protein product [Chondrus crispus]|eukprot:XP_005712355.1 unnamed protein product [Chondrus crispus]